MIAFLKIYSESCYAENEALPSRSCLHQILYSEVSVHGIVSTDRKYWSSDVLI